MSERTIKEEAAYSRACQFVVGSSAKFDSWLQENLDLLDSDFFEALKDLYLEKLRAGSDEAGLLFERFLIIPTNELDMKARAFVEWIVAADALIHGSPSNAYNLFLKVQDLLSSTDDYPSQIKLLNSIVISATYAGFLNQAELHFQEAEEHFKNGRITGTDRKHLAPLYHSYALLLSHLGQHSQSEEYSQIASELAQEFDYEELLVQIQVNQAYSMLITGQLRKAQALFLKNLTIVQKMGLIPVEAKTNMYLGAIYTLLGQPANALNRYQLAHAQFIDMNSPDDLVTVELWEGRLFEQIGALSQALLSYQSAYSQAKNLDSPFGFGDAILRMAAIYRQTGRPLYAQTQLLEGLAIWQEMGQSEYCTRVQIELSLLESEFGNPATALQSLITVGQDLEQDSVLHLDMQLALGQIYQNLFDQNQQITCRDKASQHYQQAIQIAEQRADQIHLRQALVGLAEHMVVWNTAEAAQYLEIAAKLDDSIRQELSVQELKSSYQDSTSQILSRLAFISLQEGKTTQALHYAWRAKGSALLDLLQSTPSNKSCATQNAQEINQIRQELSALQWQLANSRPDELSEFASDTSQNKIGTLRQRLYALRRQRNEASEADWDLSTLTVDKLLAATKTDLLIEYIVVDDCILAFAADKNKWLFSDVVADLDTVLELQEEVHLSFQSFLLLSKAAQQKQRLSWEAEYLPLLSELSQLLIPLDLAEFPHHKLLIAPCAPLHTVPFSALCVNGLFLIESHELTFTPTGALECVPKWDMVDYTNAILIGSSSSQKLQAVRAEINAIENLIDSAICQVDQPDTMKTLLSLERPPPVLHIAAHAQIDTESPILSYLELHDELLTIEQIYDLQLQGTELVTLSACNTASNMDTGGALLAFQTAFFIAGASSVLCSLWPVDDAATARWMSEFYTHYQNKNTPEQAISKTQRCMIAEPDYYHPAFWAAFSCNSR